MHDPVPTTDHYSSSPHDPFGRLDVVSSESSSNSVDSSRRMTMLQSFDAHPNTGQPPKTLSSRKTRSRSTEGRARSRLPGSTAVSPTSIYFPSHNAAFQGHEHSRFRQTQAVNSPEGYFHVDDSMYQAEGQGSSNDNGEADNGATIRNAQTKKGQHQKSRKSPAPTSAPSASAPTTAIPSGACDKQSGGTLPCRFGEAFSHHPVLYSLLLAAMVVLVGVRLRSRCLARHRLDQGEYRMVAAQYMDSAFDDSLSDDEGGGSDPENGDHDDGSWAAANKQSIELKSMDRNSNDGLTLEEMNG